MSAKEWISFQDCLEKVTYTPKVQKSLYLETGLYPIVSQEAGAINGYWDDETCLFKTSKPIIVFGDHTRVLKYIDFNFVLGADGVKIIVPKNFIDTRYFYFLLMSVPIESKGYARHFRYFNDFKFSIPPLPVQKAIVAKLDAAFASIDIAIAAAEQNADNAKQLFQSYLNDVFERGGERWVEKKFDEICVLQRGFDLPTQLRSEGEYPLVSSNGITDNISDFKIGSPGVVTGRSGTIGSVHYIEKSFWPLNTALYIKNFHGNCPKFIYYFLRYFKLERFSSGAGVPTLNRNVVHAALARVPEDIALQEKLAIDFDNSLQLTIRLEQIERKKKILYAEIKQSLLQQAFNGQLVDA